MSLIMPVQSYTWLETTRLGASEDWSAWVPNHRTLPASLAAPIEPTTDWEEPVSTSAPLAIWVFAAAAIRLTSEKDPVQVLVTVMVGSTDCTPWMKPSI